jgi:hypothetical protein
MGVPREVTVVVSREAKISVPREGENIFVGVGRKDVSNQNYEVNLSVTKRQFY